LQILPETGSYVKDQEMHEQTHAIKFSHIFANNQKQKILLPFQSLSIKFLPFKFLQSKLSSLTLLV
jgi:hypothetical protein